MSKNYKMPPTVEESNDIVFLLEHHYETSGLTVLKTAANELRRLYDLLRVDPVEMPEYTPNIVIRMGVVMKLASKYFGKSSNLSQPQNLIRVHAKLLANSCIAPIAPL